MLDREKLAKDVYKLAAKLFPDFGNEFDLARKTWEKIGKDESFVYRSQAAQSSFLVPRWEGGLADVTTIDTALGAHVVTDSCTVIAVDGSQIYPDRHISGAGCFLINVGGVVLTYSNPSTVTLFSQPHLLLREDVVRDDTPFSRELVDFTREAYELSMTVKQAIACKSSQTNLVCFIDGSIIFWSLESKLPQVKSFFLEQYLSSLEQLYQNKILVAGYISMPKSRELVSLIKLGLCRFSVADCIGCHKAHSEGLSTSFPCKQVDHALDTHVARFILQPGQRTTVFYSTSNIVESYPAHLRPAFVYCDVGAEIVRLEVPTWIAQDEAKLNYLCAVAIDQSTKGRGYPVCLAEAHEQAVVKGGDREFFYHLLHKIGIDYNKRIRLSQKAIKKRGIGI